MQKLVFVNGAGTQIDLTAGNFGITNWEGFSNTTLNIQTQQVPFEDGGVFLDALMEQRELAVTVAIYDGNNLELRYQKKRELISVLNPKLGEGTLIYTNDHLSKQIKAVPQIPLFENKNSNDAGTLKASVAFSCPNPYWEDIEEILQVVNSNDRKIIKNEGDVPCNVDGEIITIPSSVDLSLKNLTNNNEIKLNGSEDKIIQFSTEVGKKSVLNNNIISKNILITSDIKCIYFDNNQYYLFGVNPTTSSKSYILNSVTLEKWDIAEVDFSCITSIAKNGSLYVGTNQTKNIYCSSDLKNWIEVALSTIVTKVIYVSDKNKFYAFGTTIYSSEDGHTWDVVSEGNTLRDCDYYEEGGYFLRVNNTGEGYSTHAYLTKSADCVTWESVYDVNHQCFEKIYVDSINNVILLCGYAVDPYTTFTYNVKKSTDLTTWNTGTVPRRVTEIISNGTQYFILSGTYSNTAIYSSYDGITWERIFTDSNTYYMCMTWVEGDLLYAGEQGMINSINKNIETIKIDNLINDIICVEKKYLISVGNRIYLTEDFIKYKVVLVGDNVSSLYKIAYSEDKKIAVAVGWNGDNYYSYNLEDWESMSNINKPYIRNPVGVKYILETKKFFAYGLGFEGYGVIYYSEDGLGWTVGTTTAYYGHFQYVLNDIAYSKKLNRYVLIGSGNRFTSEDGHTWELRNNNEGGSSVIYVENEDKFYIARGVVQISSDGINFSNLNITNINKMFYQKETQKIIIIDTTGNIYISFNVFNKKFLASYTLTSMNVKLYNSDIFVFGVITSLASRLDLITQEENENIISKISASSNLNLCLEQGNNILFLSEAEGNATLLLKYRQKYIGV